MAQEVFIRWAWVGAALSGLLWTVCVGWAWSACSFSLGQFVRRNILGIGLAVLLAVVAAVSVEGKFRVLDDETNLLGVARSLAEGRGAVGLVQAVWPAGGSGTEAGGVLRGESLEPVEMYVPKRPLMFPLLAGSVGAMLVLAGVPFDYGGFGVNLGVLLGFLVLVFAALRRLLGRVAGAAGVFLVLSNPIVLVAARSSGFDFLSAAWLFLAFVVLWCFLERPTGARMALLCATLVVLCHVRYENILFLVIIAAGVTAGGYVRKPLVGGAVAMAAVTPVLLLPLGLQYYLSRGRYENPVGVSLFGVGSFIDHLEKLSRTQLDLNFGFMSGFSDVAFPMFVMTAAAAGGGFVTGRVRWSRRERRDFALLAGGCVAAQLAVALSLVHGDITLPHSQRFYLSPFVWFSLAPLVLLRVPGVGESADGASARVRLRPWHLMVLGAVLFFIYLPVSTDPSRNGLYYPEFEYQREFLRGREAEGLLLVAERPQRLTALGFGAVNFEWVNWNRRWVTEEMERGAFREVVVFQKVDTVRGRVLRGERLFPGFRLEPIERIRITDGLELKVSRAKKWDSPAFSDSAREGSVVLSYIGDVVENLSGVLYPGVGVEAFSPAARPDAYDEFSFNSTAAQCAPENERAIKAGRPVREKGGGGLYHAGGGASAVLEGIGGEGGRQPDPLRTGDSSAGFLYA